MTCIFCDIVSGSAPSSPVYEDDDTLAFLDIFPATEGHTLVVPKRHTEDLLSAERADLEAVMRTTQRVARLLDEKLSPGGINLVQANRSPAWQTVFHLHVHVIPRYADDGLVLPWTPRAADTDRLDELSARLRQGARPQPRSR